MRPALATILLACLIPLVTSGIRTGGGGGASSQRSTVLTERLYVAHDWHIGSGTNPRAYASRLSRSVNASGAGYLLGAGDICNAIAGGVGGPNYPFVHAFLADSIQNARAFSGIGNHDWDTDGGSTPVDSDDPLTSIRQLMPIIGPRGYFTVSTRLTKWIFIPNQYNTPTEACTVGALSIMDPDDKLDLLDDFFASEFAVPGSDGYEFVRSEIRNCDRPWLIVAPSHPYWPSISTGSSDCWEWPVYRPTTTAGDTINFGDMVQETRTAYGPGTYGVDFVWTAHMHAYGRTKEIRNDTTFATTEGSVNKKITYLVGPPANTTHWGPGDCSPGDINADPDTCRVWPNGYYAKYDSCSAVGGQSRIPFGVVVDISPKMFMATVRDCLGTFVDEFVRTK